MEAAVLEEDNRHADSFGKHRPGQADLQQGCGWQAGVLDAAAAQKAVDMIVGECFEGDGEEDCGYVKDGTPVSGSVHSAT
jgi:hypothetical protein